MAAEAPALAAFAQDVPHLLLQDAVPEAEEVLPIPHVRRG
jgi:hypothetical protein